MCSSGVGFNPVVDGTRYTFDVYGLYNGLFVMDDRQTGSVWTHFDGSVLTGPLASSGVGLEIQPMLQTTWGEWLARYPDSLVLDWYPEFARRYREIDPGRPGLSPQFQRTILNWDDRLRENELVLGVNVGAEFRAYVLEDAGPGLTVINDQLSGLPVVVILDPDHDSGLAFLAQVDGQPLSFAVEQGVITDANGSIWEVDGRAVDGPLAGTQLAYVTSFVTEWYGWSAYHPETGIYGR